MEILQPSQISSSGSTLDIGFQVDPDSGEDFYKAELRFRVISALSFIIIFHEDKWLKAQSMVSANELIQIDVTEIILDGGGVLDFRLQCYGLDGNVSADEVIADLGLVFYSRNDGVPVAAFAAYPVTGMVPLAVAYDGSAAFDSDGQLVAYEWDFGDSDHSNAGAQVNHLYMDPGVYNAQLTVTDDSGNSDTREIQITVYEKTNDQTSDNSTMVLNPSDIKNDAISFEIDALNGGISEALLRIQFLGAYTTIILLDAGTNREVDRKYSVRPDVWHEFDLTAVIGTAGAYDFKILGKAIFGVRLLPITEFEEIELILTVNSY